MGYTIGAGGGVADGGVTTDKLADLAVTEEKLAAEVTSQLDPGWQTQTQSANGSSVTITFTEPAQAFDIFAVIKSNSASSLVEVEINTSTGSYTYYQQFNGTPASGAGSYINAGAAGSASVEIIRGEVSRDGETAIFGYKNGVTVLGVSQGIAYKTITGLTQITSLTIKSNQANGIGAGSFISARKIR